MISKFITEENIKWAFKHRHSSTVIGGALGIAVLFILYSRGVLNEPTGMVWGAFAVLGWGLIAGLNHLYVEAKEEIKDFTTEEDAHSINKN